MSDSAIPQTAAHQGERVSVCMCVLGGRSEVSELAGSTSLPLLNGHSALCVLKTRLGETRPAETVAPSSHTDIAGGAAAHLLRPLRASGRAVPAMEVGPGVVWSLESPLLFPADTDLKFYLCEHADGTGSHAWRGSLWLSPGQSEDRKY